MNSPARILTRLLFLAALVMSVVGGARAAEPVNATRWKVPTAQADKPHRITVARLKSYSAGTPTSPPLPSWSDETTSRIGREQASLYLAGVLDSGEQDLWCITQSGIPPHEVEQTLLRDLADVPDDDNAATALRAAAKSRFPCRS